jgi:hypothetical protein
MAPRSRLWPDLRVKPPFGAATVNRGHPLAPDVFAFLVNEGAGPLHNAIGKPATTTPTAAPSWKASSRGLAQSFDGSTQYHTVPNIWTGGAGIPYTVVMLAAPLTSIPNGETYLSLDEVWAEGRVQADTSGWRFRFKTTFVTATTTPLAGRLDMLACPCDVAENGSVYVNGRIEAGPTAVGTQRSISSVHRIGQTVGVQFANFDLHFVTLYRRALTAGEIMNLYAEPYGWLSPIIRRRYFVPLGPDTLIGDGAAVAMAQSGKGIGVYISEQRPRG